MQTGLQVALTSLRKVFILKDSLKICQKHQFLKHAVAGSNAKQKQRTSSYNLEETERTETQWIHCIYLLFRLIFCSLWLRWKENTLVNGTQLQRPWAGSAAQGQITQQEPRESRTVLGPSALLLLKFSVTRQRWACDSGRSKAQNMNFLILYSKPNTLGAADVTLHSRAAEQSVSWKLVNWNLTEWEITIQMSSWDWGRGGNYPFYMIRSIPEQRCSKGVSRKLRNVSPNQQCFNFRVKSALIKTTD